MKLKVGDVVEDLCVNLGELGIITKIDKGSFTFDIWIIWEWSLKIWYFCEDSLEYPEKIKKIEKSNKRVREFKDKVMVENL